MSSNLSEQNLLNDISIDKIKFYLINNGWIKKAENKSIGSIWELKDDSNVSLILPANEEKIDFKTRLFETFLILEEVENRPKSEIYKALTKASSIARKENREIVEIVFKAVYDKKQEIKAKELGVLLKSIQDYYISYGKNLFINPKSKKKDVLDRRKSIESELELSLVDTFHGSFGLVLGLGISMQIDIFQETVGSKATEYLIDLISLTDYEHTEKFKEELSFADKNIFYDFKKIINYIVSLESNVFFDWGSVVKGKGKSCILSFERAIEVKDIIEKQEEEDPDIIELRGKFELFGFGSRKDNRKFVFKPASGKDISGHLNKELARELRTSTSQKLEILQWIYRVEIKRTMKINELTQEIKEFYELLSLERI